MKKVIAILIAALMLVTAAASAESVYGLKDPVLTMNMGEEQVFDLTGLTLYLEAGTVGETLAARIVAEGNGATLFGADVNVLGDSVVIAVDGMTHCYCVPMPEMADTVSSFDLSGLELDVEALMGEVMGELEIAQTEDGMSFRLPHTAVNKILAALAPVLEQAEIPGMDASEFAESVDQLVQSNSGIEAVGSYAQTEAGITADLALNLVQAGAATDTPVLTAYAEVGEQMGLTIDIPDAGTFFVVLQPVDEDSFLIDLGVESKEMAADLMTTVLSSDEIELGVKEIEGADAAIPVESMTDEDMELLQGELMGAAGGLIGFVFNALGALEDAA